MRFKGELLVILSAIGFALMPVFAKFSYAGGASVTTVLSFRFYFALVLIWGYIFIRKIDFKLSRKQIIMLLFLGGFFYSGSAITLFESFKYISAGLSDVLIFTYPIWVLIISVVVFKERLERKKVIAIILSFIGTFISAYSGNQSFNFLGIVLALSAGIFYASYVACIGHGQFKNIHPLVMTGYLIIGASISFTLYGLIMGDFVLKIMYYAWINIFLLGLFSTTIAIMVFCAGAKKIGTSKAAIISTVEPMITYFFGFVFLGERIKINMVIGGLIVISAIIILNLNNFLVENKGQ